MLPKPQNLSAEYGAWFKDQAIVDAYHHRPPYPPAVFALLRGLIVDAPRAVLDVGCGLGDIARPLAPLVDRLDAVDFSPGMIEKGRTLPGGDHPTLRWLLGPVESALLAPPYALITAGASLHWMAWEIVLPRFAQALTPGGLLAIVDRGWDPPAVFERLRPLFARYSANRDFRPYNLVDELTQRGLFREVGRQAIAPVPWRPTIEEYLECRHSQNGFSRTHMGAAAVAEFDRALLAALADLQGEGALARRDDGRLELTVEARVVWGRPLDPWSG